MFGRGKRQVDVVAAWGSRRRPRRGGTGPGRSRAGRRWPAPGGPGGAQADRRAAGRGGGRAGQGPRANGYPTEMWTLARVAEVIEQVTGVRYGQTQTWTILRKRLGWSRQRPARRAVERDDEAIATWVKRGVAADKKSARRRGAWIVFQDESGFSLLPPVRATWAPTGQTPVLRHRFSWTRLSMSGALAYRPDGSRDRAAVPDQRGRLQHRVADRVPHRPARAFRRREDHVDLGRPALAPVHGR